MLTQEEEKVINEIDKYVDLMIVLGKEPSLLCLNRKQYKVISKLAEKMLKSQIYSRKGQIDISKDTYRGIKIAVKEKPRRSYRKEDLKSWI